MLIYGHDPLVPDPGILAAIETAQAFAKTQHLEQQLQEKLDYLDTYANRPGGLYESPDKSGTRCHLFKDFAPHSFRFVMYRKTERRLHLPTTAGADGICAQCGKLIWEEQRFWPCNGAALCSEECGLTYLQLLADYTQWFNGGLVYDGPTEGGFPKGNLTVVVGKPRAGWGIHT